jgi:hypothetical protein
LWLRCAWWGARSWALRAEHDLTGTVQTTTAYQEIRTNNSAYECGAQPKQVTECYEIQSERAASVFEFHPTHNHWHTADAARFEVRVGSASPTMGSGAAGSTSTTRRRTANRSP